LGSQINILKSNIEVTVANRRTLFLCVLCNNNILIHLTVSSNSNININFLHIVMNNGDLLGEYDVQKLLNVFLHLYIREYIFKFNYRFTPKQHL
jgi:hypothetical protein